jgi:hypothetical protein
MERCLFCGEEIPPDAAFCPQCGRARPVVRPASAPEALRVLILLVGLLIAGGGAIIAWMAFSSPSSPSSDLASPPAREEPAPPSSPTPRPLPARPRPSPTFVPTPSPSPGPRPPEILRVEERRQQVGADLFIHKDIFFRDPDGDAWLVTYRVVWTTLSSIRVEDDPITADPASQRTGAIVTATWRCGATPHDVVLRAWIVDRAGLVSDPVDLSFSCR